MVHSIQDILEFRKSIFHDLRDELGSLKTCQTSLLIFASAGAGLFIGLVRSDFVIIDQVYLFLLPLIFLLPLWLIFYEKSRTIARIVGFLRIQEKLFVYSSRFAVIGWESAMKKYWQKKQIWDDKKFDILFKQNSHKRKSLTSVYWVSVYITFFCINCTCLIFSGSMLSIQMEGKEFIFLLFLLFLVLAIVNQKYVRFLWWKSWMDIHNREITEHTDLSKILVETMIFSILFWFCYITGLGYITSFSIKMDSYIYGIFLGSFLFILNVVLWMFRNLIKERYSYDMFEQRWQIILNILIDEKSKQIKQIDWEQWDGNIHSLP